VSQRATLHHQCALFLYVNLTGSPANRLSVALPNPLSTPRRLGHGSLPLLVQQPTSSSLSPVPHLGTPALFKRSSYRETGRILAYAQVNSSAGMPRSRIVGWTHQCRKVWMHGSSSPSQNITQLNNRNLYIQTSELGFAEEKLMRSIPVAPEDCAISVSMPPACTHTTLHESKNDCI
jgi:hypothetical protein